MGGFLPKDLHTYNFYYIITLIDIFKTKFIKTICPKARGDLEGWIFFPPNVKKFFFLNIGEIFSSLDSQYFLLIIVNLIWYK